MCAWPDPREYALAKELVTVASEVPPDPRANEFGSIDTGCHESIATEAYDHVAICKLLLDAATLAYGLHIGEGSGNLPGDPFLGMFGPC